MPRRSILREVQEDAYAPRRKPSPAPLILSLLLPLLLIPAIIPIIQLILDSSESADIRVALTGTNTPLPDLNLTLHSDGSLTSEPKGESVTIQDLPALLAKHGSPPPVIQLTIDGSMALHDLIPLLDALESSPVGGIRFKTKDAPAP